MTNPSKLKVESTCIWNEHYTLQSFTHCY